MTLASLMADSGKILAQFVWEVLYFPIWWYTRGFLKSLIWAKNFLSARLRGLALLVWVKNLFTPMFGQNDWVGKLISFFMRLVQIFARTIAFIFCIAYALAGVALWLVAPLYVVYQLIFQFTGR